MTNEHQLPSSRSASTMSAAPDQVYIRARKRARVKRFLFMNATRLVLLAAFLGIWQRMTGAGIHVGSWSWTWEEQFLGRPSTIMSRLGTWHSDGILWQNLGITLQETFIGFAIGCSLGFVVGLILGRMRLLSEVLDTFIVALYSVPKIALAPLLILWFGIDLAPKIVLVVIIVFFLVFYSTLTGTRSVDREVINALRLLGAERRHILTKAQIPSAMSHVFLGLKLSIPYALVAAIVGEFLASNRGVGSMIQDAAGQFDTSGVFAGIFLLMAVAVALNASLGVIQGRVLRWSDSSDSAKVVAAM